MISVPAGARILLAARPVDFRRGAHGLTALAREVLGENPFSVLWRGHRLALQARRPRENIGLGYQRPRADLEAIAAGIVSLAADHERRDETFAC